MRTDIQTARLRTLSEKLRTVKPEAFDICDVVDGAPEKIGCGSTACAIGHCPIFFPDEWEYLLIGDYFTALLKDDDGDDWMNAAMKFFGLSRDSASELFLPSGYLDLDERPNASDISDAIDAFLFEESAA